MLHLINATFNNDRAGLIITSSMGCNKSDRVVNFIVALVCKITSEEFKTISCMPVGAGGGGGN